MTRTDWYGGPPSINTTITRGRPSPPSTHSAESGPACEQRTWLVLKVYDVYQVYPSGIFCCIRRVSGRYGHVKQSSLVSNQVLLFAGTGTVEPS